MDPPAHQAQRRAVSPAFAPGRLARLAPAIRRQAAAILDGLPQGETFDWVDRVAKELTAATLAMLFDFDFDQRRRLTFWSDVITTAPGRGVVASWDQKRAEIGQCFDCFTGLLERRQVDEADDLVSLLAGKLRTAEMDLHQALGNILLLIVAGADTTRNSISGSFHALSSRPEQYRRLRAEPDLIPSMVAETLRWQTPIAHMRRVAARDVELEGKTIRRGDSVAMWYASANRDEALFEHPDDFLIDRPNARRHLSFGSGVHRCVGARLAELQLAILWEEILKRFGRIEATGDPVRTHSVFIRGYEALPAMIRS
jgi:cytochrome P450